MNLLNPILFNGTFVSWANAQFFIYFSVGNYTLFLYQSIKKQSQFKFMQFNSRSSLLISKRRETVDLFLCFIKCCYSNILFANLIYILFHCKYWFNSKNTVLYIDSKGENSRKGFMFSLKVLLLGHFKCCKYSIIYWGLCIAYNCTHHFFTGYNWPKIGVHEFMAMQSSPGPKV